MDYYENLPTCVRQYLDTRRIGKFGQIVRTSDDESLQSLTPFTDYKDDVYYATRKRVDELDQVTVSWVH